MSEQSKHTPGPWETFADLVWAPNAKANIAAASELRDTSHVSYTRPEIGSPNNAEIRANARLIAAAPELLEACEQLHDALADILQCDSLYLRELRGPALLAIARARIAITKSEGTL